MKQQTLCALCTAEGKGAISLIRISGPKALSITKALADFLPPRPESRKAYLGFLKKDEKLLDQALITYFAKGKSFTGEESLEISCHGGEVYKDILKALIEKGASPAPRGGFSFQAFLNGKMDLVQAEGLLRLIESRGELARHQALLQLKGELSKKLTNLEKPWLFLLSQIEADIDFSMEGLETLSEKQIEHHLKDLKKKVEKFLSQYKPFENLQKGLRVGIFGQINSGKSSLFNVLIEEDKAIVSEEEGSTRDPVEAEILNPSDLNKGLNICLKDSAGFPAAFSHRKIGRAETLAKKKSEELALQSDYKLLLFESLSCKNNLPAYLFKSLSKTFIVFTKKDLLDKDTDPKLLLKKLQKSAPLLKSFPSHRIFLTSALKGQGIRFLRKSLLALGDLDQTEVFVISERHRKALLVMEEALSRCLLILSDRGFERDLIALELRRGMAALYEILGRRIEDEILDRIFKEFCIGK